MPGGPGGAGAEGVRSSLGSWLWWVTWSQFPSPGGFSRLGRRAMTRLLSQTQWIGTRRALQNLSRPGRGVARGQRGAGAGGGASGRFLFAAPTTPSAPARVGPRGRALGGRPGSGTRATATVASTPPRPPALLLVVSPAGLGAGGRLSLVLSTRCPYRFY